MKIAFFNYLMMEYGGGTGRYFMDVSQGLKKRNPAFDIAIITFDKQMVRTIRRLYSFYYHERFIDQDIDSDVASMLKKSGVEYINVNSFSQLQTVLQQYDVIYSKNDFLEAGILNIFAHAVLKKVIFGFHSAVYYERARTFHSSVHNFLYSSFIYSLFIKNSKAFHVLNAFDYNCLHAGFPDKKIYKIANPFDIHSFKKNESRYKKNLQLPKNRLHIVWIGRLTKEKGIDDLIKLITILNSDHELQLSWTIIGEGEFLNDVLQLQKKWSNVIYIPRISYEYMPNIYKQHDVFITTSNNESFPYVVLEAQSMGLPVISYNIHGCSDIVIQNITGRLVSDLDEFCTAVVNLLNNRMFDNKKIAEITAKKNKSEHVYSSLLQMFKLR